MRLFSSFGLIVILFQFGFASYAEQPDSAAGIATPTPETVPVSELSIYEVGGMYFSTPYAATTFEADINGWYEDGEPGFSLYASYAFTDRFTMKLELPFAPEYPGIQGAKITALLGRQNPAEGLTLSSDFGVESYFGKAWSEFIPFAGFNIAKRWEKFGLLGRCGAGLDIYTEGGTAFSGLGEAEIGPFLYTGDFGLLGVPLMLEYSPEETAFNVGLDWEIYFPAGLSLSLVPRYELYGESGFSLWFSLAWMLEP